MYRRKNQEVVISTHNQNGLYFAAAFSQNGKIVRISLPKTDLEDLVTEISNYHPQFIINNKYQEIVADIAEMYYGKSSNFNMALLELDISKEQSNETSSMKTTFERDVILEVAKIPHSNVKTYKEIARALNTHGYRAVGTAIGKNPFPIVVPCHRVVRSDGNVGGFRGGKQMKINMLVNEGLNAKSGRLIIKK